MVSYERVGIICFSCFLVIIFIVIAVALYYTYSKESFVAYSGFKGVGRKDQNLCKDYHIRLYQNCIRDSGGVDFQGNCFRRAEPNLTACFFNEF